jgi:hypothetical protein
LNLRSKWQTTHGNSAKKQDNHCLSRGIMSSQLQLKERLARPPATSASHALSPPGGSTLIDALYGVATGNLNKAVQRNLERFPADFMFQLTLEEAQMCLPSRFQSGILKRGQNIKYLPKVFTQEGVTMPANSNSMSGRARRQVSPEVGRARGSTTPTG